MKTATINPLFEALINNFANLITIKVQTKKEFLNRIKDVYSMQNQKNNLFYQSVKKSDFDTIKLSTCKDVVLFNQSNPNQMTKTEEKTLNNLKSWLEKEKYKFSTDNTTHKPGPKYWTFEINYIIEFYKQYVL